MRMLRPPAARRTASCLLIGGYQYQHRNVVLAQPHRGDLHPGEPEQARRIVDQARGTLANFVVSATRRLTERHGRFTSIKTLTTRSTNQASRPSSTSPDGPLLGCVLTYLSYSAAERGDPHTAWQLAHTAIDHAESNPRAQAWMAVRAAQEAAQIGDSGAAIAELGLALDYGSEMAPAAPEDNAEPWCRFVDRAYVWAMASNVYTRLGAVDDAHAAALRALDSLSADQVKTRALVLAEAAHAFARIGGTDRAAKYATEAADLAHKLEITLVQRRLRRLLPLLTMPSTSPLARKLREQTGATSS